MRLFILLSLFGCLMSWNSAVSAAKDDPASTAPLKNGGRAPTLGGKVMWEQVAVVEGYKLQMHKLTGHYRLLDEANVRITFGTLNTCEDALARELESPRLSENKTWKVVTIGGKQFWSDVKIVGGWRIQQNVFSNHFRLLNAEDVRQTWGRLEQCEAALKREIDAGAVKVSGEKLCLLLHGILRSKDSFNKLKVAMEAEGYVVYSVNYPSTRFSLQRHAEQVDRLMDDFEKQFEQIDVVTHSMGALIARRVLSQRKSKKFGSLVMMSPPNQGALLADMFHDWVPTKIIWGPSAKEMRTESEEFARNAGIPNCRFAVIAGISGKPRGTNPLVPEDDDGVVGVSETKLDGMADFMTVKSGHTYIMNKKESILGVKNFFKHGAFKAGKVVVENGEH